VLSVIAAVSADGKAGVAMLGYWEKKEWEGGKKKKRRSSFEGDTMSPGYGGKTYDCGEKKKRLILSAHFHGRKKLQSYYIHKEGNRPHRLGGELT